MTDGDAARPFPQARVVGGGSSVMGMIALRGLPSDYDGWEARGARNWGWRDVLPYFRAMTCDLDRSGRERNTSGPNIIHRLPREKWPLYMRRIEAAVASRGMKSLSDINETAEDGFFATPLSQDRERASSARCYLTPEVRRRPNLKIMTSTGVRNLRIENDRVCGITVKHDGETVILSGSEVVVCAGAVHSAALLLRSGIGSATELKALGIESVAHRPGVGKNYQNHSLLHFAM
ncbi:MAG TPA: GMC family oxidoreductase N-terminal domain-containing protein, partial [Pseudolabrys sp.]